MPNTNRAADLEERLMIGAAKAATQAHSLTTLEEVEDFTTALSELLLQAGALREAKRNDPCTVKLVASNTA